MNVVSIPKNVVEGTISSIGTALNPNNFIEYLTTDDYNKIKEYTTAVAVTGRIAKNTYKNVKSEIKNYQTNKIMNSVNILNINYGKLGEIGNNYSLSNSPNYSLLNLKGIVSQYGNGLNISKVSLLRDNPYNEQTVVSNANKTFADQMSLEDANRYNQFWKQVEQGLTSEQRYNLQQYNRIDGLPINNNPLTEYTRHGLASAMNHDEVGIQPSSILDAVRNPIKIGPGSNHTVRYTGKEGVVNLNYDGKVTTTWARKSNYRRMK